MHIYGIAGAWHVLINLCQRTQVPTDVAHGLGARSWATLESGRRGVITERARIDFGVISGAFDTGLLLSVKMAQATSGVLRRHCPSISR